MFKILNNSKIITVIFVAVSVITSGQQVITDNIIILDQPDQGNKVYMADERIEFLPGYSFEAGSNDKIKAFINPFNYLLSNNDFANHQLSDEFQPGSIQGAQSVNGVGGFQYSIPVEIPVGTNGMTPDLGIAYNSHSGSGLLGLGWSLVGLSSISRTVKPLFLDDASIPDIKKSPKPIKSNYEDYFNLDGQIMISVDGVYGMNGTSYAFIQENYSRITSFGVEGNGPEWFELQTKDGVIIEYGRTQHGKIKNHDGTNLIWMINKVSDRNGNYIRYIYETIDDELLLKTIEYTGNSNTGLTPYNKIDIEYLERNDKSFSYIDHKKVSQNNLIKNIRVYNNGNELNRYEFEYGIHRDDTYLNKVYKYINGAQKYNPLVFKYDVISFIQEKKRLKRPNNSDFVQSNLVKMRLTGDFDGDGYADLVSVADFSNVLQPPFYNTAISIHKSLRDPNSTGDFESIYQSNNIIGTNVAFGVHPNLSLGELTLRSLFPNAFSSNPDLVASRNKGLTSGMNFEDFTGNGRSDLTYFLTSDNGEVIDGEYIKNKEWIDGFAFFKSTINNGAVDFENVQTFVNSSMNKYIKNINNFYHKGDFNGDGISDIIVVGTTESGFQATAYIIYGNPLYENSFSGVAIGTNTQIINSENNDFDAMGLASSDKVFVLDFDGDGKQDLLVVDENEVRIYSFEVKSVQSIPQVNIATLIYTANGWPTWIEPIIGDFNGDGKSDILTVEGGGQSVLISYSTGKYLESVSYNISGPTINPFPIPILNDAFNRIMAIDINGNGKTEIVHFRKINNSSEVEMNTYFLNGDDLRHVQRVFSGNGAVTNYDLKGIVVGRFLETSNPQIIIPYSLSNPSDVYLLRIDYEKSENYKKLTGIKTGNNVKTEVSYKYSNSEYDENLNFPYFALTSPINTVDEVIIDDNGVGGSAVDIVKYNFKNGIINTHGYGFLGFRETNNSNLVSDYKSVEKFELNFNIIKLMPSSLENYKLINNSEELLSSTTFQWEDNGLSNNRNIVYLSSELNNNFFNDNFNYFIQTDIDFDVNNGNIKEKIVNTNNQHLSIEQHTYGTYGTDLNFSNRIIESHSIETLGGEDPFTIISVFEYDSNSGLLEQTIKNFNTPYSLTEKFNYDDYGNVVKTTYSVSGAVDRTEEVVFDNKGRFPIKMINNDDQIATIEYHPYFDKVMKITDASGLTSQSFYDDFGSIFQTIDQQGIISTIEREWINANPNITSSNPLLADDLMWSVKEIVSGQPDKILSYNKYGQLRKKEFDGFNSPIISITTFDQKGRVIAETDPHFSGSLNISLSAYYYDDYDRVIAETKNNETSHFHYNLQGGEKEMTVTSPDGRIRKSTTNVVDQLVSSTDYDGSEITYSYFSHGGVKDIRLNNILLSSFTYDVIGRQKMLVDANSGSTTYSYAPFGEMFETNTENDLARTNLFDDVGRITQVNYTSNTGGNYNITYEYVDQGAALNSISKITTSDGMQELYEYDLNGRLKKVTEVIGGEDYSFEYEYNTFNQPIKTIYPNGFTAINEFNNKGYLTRVTDDQGNLLWEGIEQNAYAQYTSIIKGDGIITNNTFDTYQRISEIEAQNVMHHHYEWDSQTGNMNYRKDLIHELQEYFEYDNFDRLTVSTSSAINSGQIMNYHETNYLSNGNIKDKTDAGDYTYHSDKINAVIGVTNNLTQIPSFTQSIEYNIRNKTSTISEGAFKLQFQYGQDNQRRKTTLLENNVVTLEKYFVGLYEKEVEEGGNITRHINYIIGGNGITAMVIEEEDNGVTELNTYFTYQDHLGSIVALTDVNGNVVLEQSFDAWGRYRNTNDWTYNNINEPPTWLRGYTGHEHLPYFDLINMNGRIYDPILGRMLSPDKYVQDPMSSQSYNRYSYVWNNPLKYSDPSGDFVVALSVGIGMVAGAYIGGSVVNNSFNMAEWGKDNASVSETIAGVVIGSFFGGIIGFKTGLALAAGTISGKSILAKSFAGVINSMYNYEPGQGALLSAAYFSAGFIGTSFGISNASSVAAMAGGGFFNTLVFGMEVLISREERDNLSYELLQKFVGGALSSLAGVGAYAKMGGFEVAKGYKGKEIGNYLFDNKYYLGKNNVRLNKSLLYGVTGNASDFAYSNRYTRIRTEGYEKYYRNFWQRLTIFGGGMVAGYALSFEEFPTKGKSNSERFINQLTVGSIGYGSDLLIGNWGRSTSFPNGWYDDGWQQKTRIISVKDLVGSLTSFFD